MKPKFLSLSFLAIFCFVIDAPLFTQAIAESPTGSRFSDLSLNVSDDFFLFAEEEMNAQPGILRALSPQEVLDLINTINGISIIQEVFYLHTNPLNERPLHYLPLFTSGHFYRKPTNFSLSIQPFFSTITHSFFTKKHDHLSSYLALQEDTLLEKLRTTFQALAQFDESLFFDTDLIFSLFKNVSVEQRRIGGMVAFSKQWKTVWCRLLVPLYYLERNYFLTDREKKAIEDEFGVTSPDEQKRFQKKHLISDKIGFGDMRFECDARIASKPAYDLRLGGFITLPTGFQVASGLRGSTFERSSTYPHVDLLTLFNVISEPTVADQQKIFQTVTGLALDALDRLSANLLDSTLNNGRHVGLGIALKTKLKLKNILRNEWAQQLNWKSHLSLECLLPSREKRFFVNNVDTQGFERRNFTDPATALDNLKFLSEQTVERFFLRAFSTHIFPGFVFNSNSKLEHKGRWWDGYIGTDTWVKTAEKLKISMGKQLNVAKNKARLPLAYQSSVTAGIGYTFKNASTAMRIGVDAFGAVLTQGIGKEYGISFVFESIF